jgi:hypothetical protein
MPIAQQAEKTVPSGTIPGKASQTVEKKGETEGLAFFSSRFGPQHPVEVTRALYDRGN